MGYQAGVLTVTAGAALGAHVRVKVKSGTTTDPVEVEAAGVGEQHIGTTEVAAASGALVAVRPRTMSGSQLGTASEAFARGATLYGAAAGKIADTSSGSAIGIALEAATADGDIVEFIDFSVLSTTSASTSIADSGGFTAATTVEAALAEIYQDLLSTQQFIPVPLAGLLETNATNVVAALGAATTPKIDMASGDTDSGLVVTWAASNSDPVLFQTPLPPDLDTAADIVVHLRAKSGGATDTPTIASDSYFNEGDTKVEDASAAVGATFAENTITIAAADVPAGAQTLTVELTPGAHTTDTVVVSAIWVEYKRAILTA
jgi:hypothetical protein